MILLKNHWEKYVRHKLSLRCKGDTREMATFPPLKKKMSDTIATMVQSLYAQYATSQFIRYHLIKIT